MVARIWNGAVGDWNTDADWSPASSGDDAPLPGDAVAIASGEVILTSNARTANQLFENNALSLGSAAGAVLLLRNASATGTYFSLKMVGAATLEADGLRAFGGNVSGAPNDGSTLSFKADAGGQLVFLSGASFSVTDHVIDFSGAITFERSAQISGNIVNNGVISVLQGVTTLATNSLTGTGTIAIGLNGKLVLSGYNYGGAQQTIDFVGAGGVLALDYSSPGNFSGAIVDFSAGDAIDFVGYGATTSGVVDAVAHRLTLTDTSGQTYVFNNFYGEAGTLTGVRQSNGHYLLTYGGAPSVATQIDAGAVAMRANIAQTMTLPGTATPITGAGVKVGIISDSFNINGGAASDVANGYLPASGVTVLREGEIGDHDEGRAMAELIAQSAPGASLYFATCGLSDADFAASVEALVAAGCKVIVDDIALLDEGFFQLGGAAENAISAAIAAGVTFVSSAGNYGDAYFQSAFSTSTQILYDGSSVQAMSFANGTPYQSVTAVGGSYDSIMLQWNASYYGADGATADQPGSVVLKAFDPTTHALVATSYQVTVNGQLVAESELDLPAYYSSKTYDIAIYHADGTPIVSEIKYLLTGYGFSGGTGVGGVINDPTAGAGSGAIAGHQLIPGNIVVGAVDVANTAATGATPDYTENFSSTGTGQLLFDPTGAPLTTAINPGSPDLVGPDGVQTSVSGFTPFYGTSAAAPNVAAVAALLLQANPDLTPAQISEILTKTALPLTGVDSSVAGAGLVQADQAVLMAEELACFCAGMRLAAEAGATPVEALRIGDRLWTRDGGLRPIVWIGRTSVARRFVDPLRGLPIRIKAGALGENCPGRDLLLSPDHAVLIDGVLIHAGALVNGASILRDDEIDEIFVYYHVELAEHAVIFAENAPVESFIETSGQLRFDNWLERGSRPGTAELPFPRAKSRRQIPARIRAALAARSRADDAQACAVA